jgi:hypothetical protein
MNDPTTSASTAPDAAPAPNRAAHPDGGHRRLVRALWLACVLAGAWLATHDARSGGAGEFAANAVVAAGVLADGAESESATP